MALATSAAAGAALMYFFDPDRGTLRRKLVGDKLVRVSHVGAQRAGSTARDLSNRAGGIGARIRNSRQADDADDGILEQRVRAELGRVVSHPRAIKVSSGQARITLTGDVLAHEVDRLVDTVRQVKGVADVDNQLAVHKTGDGISSLQGGVGRTGAEFELAQENWSPAARFLTGITAGALAMYGLRRKDLLGTVCSAAGIALAARATTNTDLERLIGVGGGRRAVDIQKTIRLDAPLETVFDFFTDWERWPEWMSHVRSVTTSDETPGFGQRTHWVVDAPAGTTVEWDSEVTQFVPNELISWRSVEGAAVRNAGSVRFDRNDDGSVRVHVQMTYNPPAGVVGHAVASLFGKDPKKQLDDDLVRLKTTIEEGRPPHDAAAVEARR
jgi:uncharacterized membrane protein